MSEEMKRNLNIEATHKDGTTNIVSSQYLDDDEMDEFEMLSLLTSSVSMTLKLIMDNMDHETQGRLMSDVIDNLEKSFADYKSFPNVKKFERPTKHE